MFKIKFRLLAQNAFDELLHHRSVIGMNPLANQLQLGLNRPVIIKDFVSFLRPIDFSAANVPPETAGVTYALPLSQEILAALQVRIQVRDRSIVKDHAPSGPDHVMKCGYREIRFHDGCLSNDDLDPAVAGSGLGLDLRLVTPEKDEQTPLGPGMLHRDSQELLDQLGEVNLAREGL